MSVLALVIAGKNPHRSTGCVRSLMERQGVSIRNVESGHFKDIFVDVATISLSSALLVTITLSVVKPLEMRRRVAPLSEITLSLLIVLPILSFATSSSTGFI